MCNCCVIGIKLLVITSVAEMAAPAPHISHLLRVGYKICCHANVLDAEKKASKLPTVLGDEALAVWLELTEEQQNDYDVTKAKTIDAIMLMWFVFSG